MNVFSLRAKTLDDKFYQFTVLDVPVITGENTVVLLGRKFSPMLKYDTIVVGSDVGVYVGDVLRDEDGTEWIATYDRGVKAKSIPDRRTKYLYEFKRLRVVRQATKEEWRTYRVSTPILVFKYKDYTFDLSHIIGKHRRDLVVLNIPDSVNVKDVKQSARATIKRQRIFLGDEYKGSPVVMCYGCLCIQNEFGAYDIFSRKYIL